jgi:hypothetical protein
LSFFTVLVLSSVCEELIPPFHILLLSVLRTDLDAFGGCPTGGVTATLEVPGLHELPLKIQQLPSHF